MFYYFQGEIKELFKLIYHTSTSNGLASIPDIYNENKEKARETEDQIVNGCTA